MLLNVSQRRNRKIVRYKFIVLGFPRLNHSPVARHSCIQYCWLPIWLGIVCVGRQSLNKSTGSHAQRAAALVLLVFIISEGNMQTYK